MTTTPQPCARSTWTSLPPPLDMYRSVEHPTTGNAAGHRPNDPAARPSHEGQPRRLRRAPARRSSAASPLSREWLASCGTGKMICCH
jgi:hypothetical protein